MGNELLIRYASLGFIVIFGLYIFFAQLGRRNTFKKINILLKGKRCIFIKNGSEGEYVIKHIGFFTKINAFEVLERGETSKILTSLEWSDIIEIKGLEALDVIRLRVYLSRVITKEAMSTFVFI